jgi:hypothetical protein
MSPEHALGRQVVRRRGPSAVEMAVEGTEPGREGYVYALRDEAAYLQVQPEDEKQEIFVPFDPASIVCQFCGRSYQEVPNLFEAKRKVRDPNNDAIASVWICDGCVARMTQILAEEPPGARSLWWWGSWWPGDGPQTS